MRPTPSYWHRVLLGTRNRHLALVDLVLLPMAAVLAFVLRLDSTQIQRYIPTMLLYALAAPIIMIPIFSALGLYSRFWQYASTDELNLLVWAAILGGFAQGALFLGTQAIFPSLITPAVPRSIPLIDILLILAFIITPRFVLRVGTQNPRRPAGGKNTDSIQLGQIQHVLIVGAGPTGANILREIWANPQTGLVPVGFVDDDPAKHGVLIHRIRVLGGRDNIPELVRKHHVEQVIIAMPGVSGKIIREIAEICDVVGVRARVIPGMYELLDDTVHINQLRDVQIEDLLRREPVSTDTAQVAALLQGKRVLVTGAGGSIGAELCRQIARCAPSEIILLGHGENSIFHIAEELQAELTQRWSADPSTVSKPALSLGEVKAPATVGNELPAQPRLHAVIADIRFAARVEHVMQQYRPEVIFHAAAHKHVPLMETNAEDAITNNVLGTKCLLEASIASNVSHFVFISSDKAVHPSSVMGATKRIAEGLVQDAAARTGRCFVSVRFGNVLGSRGSVVPIFRKQIAAGGPVTVTHPDVRRYFMTIPEAVQLVLQAAALGRGGEIFVLDMGQPVRIVDLARDLIRLSGLEPDRDIQIRFTGLRPGDKLYEEMFSETEHYAPTQHEKILVCCDARSSQSPPRESPAAAGVTPPAGAGGGAEMTWSEGADQLIEAAEQGDTEKVRQKLGELVSEYLR